MASASVMVAKRAGEPWNNINGDLYGDKTIREDLAHIKEWLKKQPHLPDEWDEICLMSFLRGCDFSLEKCKAKLNMYFTMRTACPEFFLDRDITRPELSDMLAKGYGPTMPGLTPEGRRVTILKAKDMSLDPRYLIHLYKITVMEGDLRLREPTPGVTGEIYILDADIVKASHLGNISLSVMKKFLICVQGAYPLKLKELHVINTSALIDAAYNIAKPFVKEKIKSRIYFHKDYTSLHEYIPKELLPLEFDGTGGSLEELNNAWYEKLKANRSWFKEQESFKANEALRPGKPTNYEELFGIEGSFRKLAID